MTPLPDQTGPNMKVGLGGDKNPVLKDQVSRNDGIAHSWHRTETWGGSRTDSTARAQLRAPRDIETRRDQGSGFASASPKHDASPQSINRTEPSSHRVSPPSPSQILPFPTAQLCTSVTATQPQAPTPVPNPCIHNQPGPIPPRPPCL